MREGLCVAEVAIIPCYDNEKPFSLAPFTFLAEPMTPATFRSLLMSGVVRRLLGAAVLVGLLWLAVGWAVGEPSPLTLQ